MAASNRSHCPLHAGGSGRVYPGPKSTRSPPPPHPLLPVSSLNAAASIRGNGRSRTGPEKQQAAAGLPWAQGRRAARLLSVVPGGTEWRRAACPVALCFQSQFAELSISAVLSCSRGRTKARLSALSKHSFFSRCGPWTSIIQELAGNEIYDAQLQPCWVRNSEGRAICVFTAPWPPILRHWESSHHPERLHFNQGQGWDLPDHRHQGASSPGDYGVGDSCPIPSVAHPLINGDYWERGDQQAP